MRPPVIAPTTSLSDTARQRANKRAIRQLEAIGPPPHLDAKQFGTRVRWASNFGGVTRNETYGGVVRGLLASLLRSPDYSTGDVLRTVHGITSTQAALLPELATLDLVRTLPRLEVPIVMVQGRHDQVAPGAAAERLRQLPGGTEQTTGLVRELGPYAPPRRTGEIPGSSWCECAPVSSPTSDLQADLQRRAKRPGTTETRSLEMQRDLDDCTVRPATRAA